MKALRSEQRKDRVVYPYGTFKMRKLLDVSVEAPDPSMLITGPEPTLEEVKAELRENPRAADDERVHERVSELLSDVAGAFRAEALEVVKTDALELVSEPRRVPQELIDESSRPETLVQHRFDKRVPTEARRIVVHRDARRGRPRKGGGPKRRNVDEPLSRADADPPRGGSDPPR